ncbi:unnamed protein product [Lymnaea stagnalis]|uniref:Uncharacterized protein n=1 Tax=Lymnaea stagnalis TaxID=6523 RepID=A0AAV2I2E3_LYMST
MWTFLLMLDFAVAQIHLGPIGNAGPPTCYNCDDEDNIFPACVNKQVTCHLDEVCSVRYGHGLPTFKCQKNNSCVRDVSHPLGNCTGGGVQVDQDSCELCCHTTECVQEIKGALLQEFPLHLPYHGLFCPGHCIETELATCITTGAYCHDGQFCKVGINDRLMVQGHCTDTEDIQECFDDKSEDPCVLPVGQAGHMSKCVWDCCSTSACLIAHFGAYMDDTIISQTTVTHVAATLAPTPPPTQAPTPPPTQAPTPTSVNCYQCDGDVCHHNEKNATCPGGFCMLTVDEDTGGSRLVNKRCSDETECYNSWSNGWRDDQLCAKYLLTPKEMSGQDMSCRFCCTGDFCNNHIDIQNVHKF